MLTVFIGWDAREVPAYHVAKHSLLRHASVPVNVIPLIRKSLAWSGIYSRAHTVNGKQSIDDIDGLPFSTEFSFTRFLTPIVGKKLGADRVLFCDCDFLFLADVAELANFEMKDPVAVVKHDFTPKNDKKMDGIAQQPYPCKLWSSLMLFDLTKETPLLTQKAVNTKPGSWLHQFKWAPSVGELPKEWNFIPEFSEGTPKAVHYTEGVPMFPGYETKPYADLWLREKAIINSDETANHGSSPLVC